MFVLTCETGLTILKYTFPDGSIINLKLPVFAVYYALQAQYSIVPPHFFNKIIFEARYALNDASDILRVYFLLQELQKKMRPTDPKDLKALRTVHIALDDNTSAGYRLKVVGGLPPKFASDLRHWCGNDLAATTEAKDLIQTIEDMPEKDVDVKIKKDQIAFIGTRHYKLSSSHLETASNAAFARAWTRSVNLVVGRHYTSSARDIPKWWILAGTASKLQKMSRS
jgi:hypothetical protein